MGLCCSLCNEEQESTVEEAQISAVEEAQRTADDKTQTSAADETQESAVDETQESVDDAQRSTIDETQESAVDETQESAVAKSSSVHSIDGELRFEHSLPRHNFIQDLVEDFRQSSLPECVRRVTFSPDKILREYVSASYHLPGAYVDVFPCRHCTHKGRTSFVEVFHFANVRTPSLCATATFVMPADAVQVLEPTGCRVEVDFSKGCPSAPIAVDHSPRHALHMCTDVFIEVLRFLSRIELEKTMLVSRRWSNVTGWAAGTLRQRRDFFVTFMFYGESPGLLGVHFFRSVRGQWPTLRVLTTRGLSQAHNAVRLHLRNAFVERVIPFFRSRLPAPDPPLEMLVDITAPARIDWLKSLLRSMPPNSEIESVFVADANIGFDNFLTVTSCALEQHRKLACVRNLYVCLVNRAATWARLSNVLNQPSTRAFNEISVSTTRVAIDPSELRALLSSWQSRKLHIYVESGVEPQDGLLTLPAQIIRDFLALRDANSFIAEFSLLLEKPDNIAFAEMPHVSEATDRRKRFRCRKQGQATVVRVSIYEKRAACEYLTVVTFDNFRRTVLFLKGNVSLADLRLTVQRPYVFH
ncbi:hypothetical protein AAVH_37480 [Aphelenchoides avenae]|nr:hypothetical protein AAVH_37480 [Aphelenchus avenae]